MAVTRTAPDADEYLPASSTSAPASEWEKDDEDEAPASSSLIQKGWGAAKKAMSESSNFTNDFRFSDEPQVVKFLSSEPYTFKQHFLEKKSGKKSYVCLGKGCPLCRDLGDTPSNKFAFPIVNLDTEGYPTQLVVAGPRLCTMLEKLDSGRQGPLEANYYALSRTGTKSSTSYSVQLVKPRDLADDWDLDPDVVDAYVTSVEVPGPDAIYVNSLVELTEIAQELSD